MSANLDIWGKSLTDKYECFACGEYYIGAHSTAPEDYQTTYCSLECYTKDHAKFQQDIAAVKAAIIGKTTANDVTKLEAEYEIRQVGDFKLKIRKEEESS